MNCILIILFILFSSEKNIIDMFAEQYGNYQTPKSEKFFDCIIFCFITILFLHSYFNLKIQFSSL